MMDGEMVLMGKARSRKLLRLADRRGEVPRAITLESLCSVKDLHPHPCTQGIIQPIRGGAWYKRELNWPADVLRHTFMFSWPQTWFLPFGPETELHGWLPTAVLIACGGLWHSALHDCRN